MPSVPLAGMSQLLDRFSGLKVAVLGEAMLDGYVEGGVTRLCPEGPVPVVDVSETVEMLGGAANSAANLAALGAEVTLVTVVGADAAGDSIRHLTSQAGVSAESVLDEEGRATLHKRRVVGDGRVLLRLDEGSRHAIGSRAAKEVIRRLNRLSVSADLLLVSDYRYGVVSDSVFGWLADGNWKGPVVVDSKQPARLAPVRPLAVTPNYSEAIELVEAEPETGLDRVQHIAGLGGRLREVTAAEMVAVTMDRDGVVVIDGRTGTTHLPSLCRGARHPAGAGDTFTAAMSLALAAGADGSSAAAVASRAAAVVVDKPNTSTCSLDELRGLVEPSKLCENASVLEAVARQHRAAGDTVVFTNGCFDVLHAGHIGYLEEAKQLGDVLVVAVNSDASVRRLKGEGRPVNPLEDRMAVLAGLSSVDHLVAFDQDTPLDLLRRIRPDVYCKGGDYRGRRIPEEALVQSWGGRFELLSHLPSHSTTATVERIRQSTPVPAALGR